MTNDAGAMTIDRSCVGCKFLYGDGSGYSNYTWMDTYARCALDLNPSLRDQDCGDLGAIERQWSVPFSDEWPPTMHGRCNRYSSGPYVELDPDRDNAVSSQTQDVEQIDAICAHDSTAKR